MRHFEKVVSSVGFVIRKFSGRGEGAALLRGSTGSSHINRPNLLQTSFVFALLVLVPVLALALTALAMHVDPHTAGLVLAAPGVIATPKGGEAKKPAKIREMESNLKSLAKELEEGQTEMAAGPISPERGEELESKAKEMEELQSHLDQYNKIAGITRKARQVDKVTLPEEEEGYSRKKLVTTPGHLFVASDSFKLYREQGKQSWSSKVDLKRMPGKTVTLRGEAAAAFEKKAFDPAMLSSLGEDAIIQVDRDGELVRFEEPEILTLRDVLNGATTGSDAIKYVAHVSTTRAAASQATPGALKNFLKIAFEPKQVSVETIAVLSKVTEQDVDDAPRLVSYINGEMVLDIKVEEERQIAWGDGTSGQLVGLFDEENALPEFDRAGVDDTIIDVIRKMRTDLRKVRVAPDFVAIDPLDWETIELAKGSDDRYIWGLITDLRGPRIWSLRVVESDAMTHPDTGERRILMGDGKRGATVYDRGGPQLAIGFMDDDFGRNLRTLRAEERLALAVKRAYAFVWSTTQAGES